MWSMIWILRVDEACLRAAHSDDTRSLDGLISDEINAWCTPSGIRVDGSVYRQNGMTDIWCVPVDVDVHILAAEFGLRPAETELPNS